MLNTTKQISANYRISSFYFSSFHFSGIVNKENNDKYVLLWKVCGLDFILVCDDGRVQTSRSVLTRCSDEFEKVLAKLKYEFRISNVPCAAVEEFTRFFYEKNFHISIEFFHDVGKLIKTYEPNNAWDQFLGYVPHHMSLQNLVYLLQLALDLGMNGLKHTIDNFLTNAVVTQNVNDINAIWNQFCINENGDIKCLQYRKINAKESFKIVCEKLSISNGQHLPFIKN